MKIKKINKTILVLSLSALFLSGCGLTVNTNGGSGGRTDGGVYKSTDKGASWEQKTLIQSAGAARSFASVDIIDLVLDPSDSQAIYAGSLDTGLFFSYDGAGSWQIADGLGKVTVNQVAVDPLNKCVIYAAAANKLYKSDDCNRGWSQIYFDNDLNLKITALAIDPFNSSNVFAGTSRGGLIKSSDHGLSWRALERLDSQVDKIVISPASAEVMFAGTASRGLFRSLDRGVSWTSLANNLRTFNDSQRFRDLIMVKRGTMEVFLANNYGLLKSTDNGDTWVNIPLLTPEKQARINAIAVNPANTAEIYYVTDTAFYRSADGGGNWSSRKLPTNRAGSRLLLDPENSAIIYLAARRIK